MKYTNFTIFVFSLFFFFTSVSAQSIDAKQAYNIENEGYISTLQHTPYGIVFTDNYASCLYLYENNQVTELLSAASCGRYFTLSKEKNLIGFKWITASGLQAPAIYDLEKREIRFLHEPVKLCGQVNFSDNGTVCFTVEEKLFVIHNGSTKTYKLPLYVNICPVSPDAKKVVYNNLDDELFMFDLESGDKQLISPTQVACVYPKWSPDGKKILFNSVSGNLFCYEIEDNKIYDLGTAANPQWNANSEYILVQENKITDFVFESAELKLVKYDGTETVSLTNTLNVFEMGASWVNEDSFIYHNFNKKEIFTASLNFDKSITDSHLIGNCSESLHIRYFNVPITENKHRDIVKIEGVPYVHQVFDTPTWHDGYGSCAPSTAIMALAYYNVVPPWPTSVNHPPVQPHTNDYGSYVADKYWFNAFFYDLYKPSRVAWGGYGFMWTNGSPNTNSRMKVYIEQHGVESNHVYGTSFSYTTTEIDLGYPHPICSFLTSAGHLTLAIGYLQDQHTIIFNDPYGDKNTPGYPSYDGAGAMYDWPGYNNGYQNLDPNGSYGGIAWTVRSRFEEKVYNDTIIDDLSFGHGFYMFNEPPSHMQWFRDVESGYNQHFWWTKSISSGSDVCWVTWTPTLSEEGNYKVFAYIPNSYANAEMATYKISHAGEVSEVIINQNEFSSEWVLLGEFYFDLNNESSVYLGDNTSIPDQYLAFDAVAFSRSETAAGFNNLAEAVSEFSLSPNPVSDVANISYFSNFNENIIVEVVDIQGRTMFSSNFSAKIGWNNFSSVSFSDIKSGIYVVRLKSSQRVMYQKIVVE